MVAETIRMRVLETAQIIYIDYLFHTQTESYMQSSIIKSEVPMSTILKHFWIFKNERY